MIRRAATLCLCLCLAAAGGLAVAGCGSDSKKKTSSSKSKKKSSSSKTPTVQSLAVTMQNISFQPNNLSVKKGGTITWANNEAIGHDVTADDGSFKSGPAGGMKQGDNFEHTFDQTGSFAYKCTIHPNMTGTIEVTE